jgi:hypothetical protein
MDIVTFLPAFGVKYLAHLILFHFLFVLIATLPFAHITQSGRHVTLQLQHEE